MDDRRMTAEKLDAVRDGKLCPHCFGTGFIPTPNGRWTGCRNCEAGRGPSRLPTLPPLRPGDARKRGDELDGVTAPGCARCEDGLIEVPGGGWDSCDCERGKQRADARENDE